MHERIEAELALIQRFFPAVVCEEQGRWMLIPSYSLPEGWNRQATDVAFQIDERHPVSPPYGFYVPSGIQFKGAVPNSYTDPASNHPPFRGTWGFFSWAPLDGIWKPTADVQRGSNLLQWIRGFSDRFQDGA